ncbi:hypothetical protein ABZY93_15755 [Streptomyces smyrnaeus]
MTATDEYSHEQGACLVDQATRRTVPTEPLCQCPRCRRGLGRVS